MGTPGKKIDDVKAARILQMLLANRPRREIVRECDVSTRTIYYLWPLRTIRILRDAGPGIFASGVEK
jgi:hypothetical protein